MESLPVYADLYMVFKRRVSFTTNLAVNFGCDLIQLFPSFCTQPSEVTVPFNWNMNRYPVL